MAQLSPLLYGVVLPLVVSALLLFGLWAPLRKWPHGLVALSVTAGFIAAQIALTGVPALPPDEASQWLPWLLPLLLLLCAVGQLLPKWARALSTGLIYCAGLYLLLRPMVEWTWSGPWVSTAWIAGFTAIGLAILLGLSRFAQSRQEGRAPRFAAIALLSITAIALAASGSLMLGQLAGAMAAALGPIALVKPKNLPFHGATLWVVSFNLAAVIAMGVCYANLAPLLAAGLGLAGLALILPVRTKTPAEPSGT